MITTFTGASGGHPYLLGYDVVVVSVLKGTITDPDTARVLKNDEDIALAGGVDANTDRVEVAPLLADPRAPGGKRPSWATSDALVGDLEMFAHGFGGDDPSHRA